MGLFLEWLERKKLREANATLGQTMIGTGAYESPEGVHIAIMSPEGGKGTTSAIKGIRSTNHPDGEGRTLYLVKTANSNYTVAMDAKVAQHVLPLFFKWQNAPGQLAQGQINAAQQQGRLGGSSRKGSARIIH